MQIIGNINIAIYNSDLKRIEYIVNSLPEATRIITGEYLNFNDSKVRYALAHKKRIEDSILGYSVSVRYATAKQLVELGNKKFIKINHG